MVDQTQHSNSAASAQEEAAFVDAYEARMAGGSAGQVPAQWREEIESMVRLHERVSALPLPEVSPSVRAIVLGAAAQAVAERPVSVWARLAHWLLRPGPILVGATAAAVVFALAVRQEKPQAPVDAGAVALLENAAEPPAAAEPAPSAAPVAAPQATAAAPAAPAAVAQAEAAPEAAAAAAAAPREVAAAKPAAEAAAKAIAAQPASVAPQGAADLAAASAKEEKAPAAQWNADSAIQPQRREAAAEDEQLAKASRRPVSAPVMAALGSQNAKASGGAGGDAVQKDQPANNQQFAQAPPANAVQAEAAARPVADYDRQETVQQNAKAPASDNLAQAKGAAVAKLRADVERTTDPAKRAALLQQLVAVASQAGDAKTAAWAKEQLGAANRANANNAGSNNGSGSSSSGKAKAAAESAPAAPAQKPAAEKSKSTSY